MEISMDISPPMISPPGSIAMYRVRVDMDPLNDVQAAGSNAASIQSLVVSWHFIEFINPVSKYELL